MAKRKYPSELNTRTVRVNIGDWHWLNSLSQKLGITVAETFHKIVTRQSTEPVAKAIVVPRSQIPMPAFRATTLVTLPVKPQSIIATNGSKAAAFRIKPKGVRHA
ncbi:hypothetical protein ES705_45887 [subsurface metagenome]|jgi:hypothetical protein